MITLAIPSKGRLMEACQERFAQSGVAIERAGTGRGYRGRLAGIDGLEIAFLPAGEIAQSLRDGKIDLGVTGEDLLRETITPGDGKADAALRLGFGFADVVAAVPEGWLDVAAMGDLDDVAASFFARHGRRLRVATKYKNLTRRFFAAKGVTGYRVVESQGATEGAPAAGIAEMIVDITTTGSTLKANHLKILDDGVILKSEAVLAARTEVLGDPAAKSLLARLAGSAILARKSFRCRQNL